MDITIEDNDGVTLIALSGKLDQKGAESVDLRFTSVAGKRPLVVVDLSKVDYMASIGIRMLVMAGKAAARQGHKMALFGACEPVAKVITTSGLDQIIPLAADWAGARSLLV